MKSLKFHHCAFMGKMICMRYFELEEVLSVDFYLIWVSIHLLDRLCIPIKDWRVQVQEGWIPLLSGQRSFSVWPVDFYEHSGGRVSYLKESILLVVGWAYIHLLEVDLGVEFVLPTMKPDSSSTLHVYWIGRIRLNSWGFESIWPDSIVSIQDTTSPDRVLYGHDQIQIC